jgi:hypothetical protein
MMRKKVRRSFLAAEEAVSVVIGFVLIMGIVLSVTAIFFAQQVPELTKEFEAEHASKLIRDFADLGAIIDMAVLSEDPTSSAACPIGMESKSIPLAGVYSTGGALRFDSGEEGFACLACAPEETEDSGTGSCNTTNFLPFENDSFHVKVTAWEATLEPEIKEDRIIENDTILLVNCYDCYYDRFIVRNNATLTIKGGAIKIHASNLVVEAGSEITASGEGWPGGAAGENGSGQGGGLGADAFEEGGGGGGFGGAGGAGGGNPGSGGSAIGLVETLGSGGGGGNDWKDTEGQPILGSGGNGGNGGGLIWLEATSIDISGIISSNGSIGEGKAQYSGKGGFFKGAGGGGGSGGYILLKGDVVNITGKLYAVGGNGGEGETNFGAGGGGGGGGIVEVTYDESLAPSVDAINSSIYVGYGVGGAGSAYGDPGDDGQKLVYRATFIPTILYHSSGYLVSNMTQSQGQIGYDTQHYLVEYGNLTYDTSLPLGTDLIVKVRSSMDPNMKNALPWEKCPPVVSGQDISDLSSVSDGHRYLQWRAELLTFNPSRTPVLHAINISYEYGEQPVLASSSGCVDFNSRYLYLPNFKLIYAHGATIRNQTGGGDFFVFSPPISVSKQGNVTSLKVTDISLTGGNRTISGGLSSTIHASYGDAALVTDGLIFYNLTLKVTTHYPTAWENWFNETCKDAGLTWGTSPGNYYIRRNGPARQLIFYGDESRPLSLWLKKSAAQIEIEK